MKPTFSYLITINGVQYAYQPLDPHADYEYEEFMGKHERVMYRHSINGFETFIAPKGELTAGWVIGYLPERSLTTLV